LAIPPCPIQSDFEKEDVANLVCLNVKQDQIDTYSQATQNNPSGASSDQNNNSNQASSPAQQYNEAKNAYYK
jgi:hypothetical protein